MYTVDFEQKAFQFLNKLDKTTRDQILKYIKKLKTLEDPAVFGKPLLYGLKNYWRYRVGKYRILCEIEKQKLVIIIVSIGHRNDVYDNENL